VVAPGAPGPGGNPPCDAPIANVSRPPNGISGGTTTDLGGTGPSISSDGGFVVFTSRTKFDPDAAEVDQVYRRNVGAGAIVPVSRPARAINGGAVTDAGGRAPSISSDGRFVSFVTRTKFDANAADVDQVYVRDLQTGNVLRVSTPAGGTTDLGGGSPVISGDGRFVVFVTRTKFDANAADVDQVYRRDLQTGTIVPVTRPAQAINGGAVTDAGGRAPSISSDGRSVSFVTRTKFDAYAADGDQVYVRELQTGNVLRVSTPAQGISGGSTQDLGGSAPVISGDGRFVAFVSRTRFDPNAPDVDEIYRRCLERP
jgi:Tol biopolymer transport system component